MTYTFSVVMEPDEGTIDSAEGMQDLLEEAIRDAGLDNGIVVKVELVSEEEG